MLMEVTCRCGWSARGSKAEVVKMVQAHAKSAHNLEVTAREVAATWRVVETAPAADEQHRERE